MRANIKRGKVYLVFVNRVGPRNFTILGEPVIRSKKNEQAVQAVTRPDYGEYDSSLWPINLRASNLSTAKERTTIGSYCSCVLLTRDPSASQSLFCILQSVFCVSRLRRYYHARRDSILNSGARRSFIESIDSYLSCLGFLF